jgi:molybdate transport system substrate-binding protein
MRRIFLSLIAAAALTAGFAVSAKAQEITVYAAASMTDALEAIAVPLRAKGVAAKFAFGSSSTLARQIENGAPADVFVSADEEWMNYLAMRNLIVADSRKNFAGNDLVLIAPADKPIKIEISRATDFPALLGPQGRIATGDPAHVPVGRYAKAALENLGLWNAVGNRIAGAENVRVALTLVERGEAPLGIVYGTDAKTSPRVAIVGVFPAGSYPPVTYPAAIVAKRDTKPARGFIAFLVSAEGKAILQRFGFSTPNSAAPN